MALVSQFLSVDDEKQVMLYSTKSNARMIGHRPPPTNFSVKGLAFRSGETLTPSGRQLRVMPSWGQGFAPS